MRKQNYQLLIEIKKAGLTQTELAARVDNLSESKLSRIIKGYTEPTSEEVIAISKTLKLEPANLGFKKDENGK